jgi:hypothetical protein
VPFSYLFILSVALILFECLVLNNIVMDESTAYIPPTPTPDVQHGSQIPSLSLPIPEDQNILHDDHDMAKVESPTTSAIDMHETIIGNHSTFLIWRIARSGWQ